MWLTRAAKQHEERPAPTQKDGKQAQRLGDVGLIYTSLEHEASPVMGVRKS